MSTTIVSGDTLSSFGHERVQLFLELNKRAREIEQQCKSTWVELADLCITMRDDQLWKEGNFHSYNAWLMDACPTSRSLAYLAVGIREELTDIPTEDLKQIPPGSAEVLKNIPRQSRNGKIIKAAKKQTPREFVATVAHEVPEAHIEQKQCHKFRLTTSQSKIAQEAFDRWRFMEDDPDAPAEAALEGILADYLIETEFEYDRKRKKSRG